MNYNKILATEPYTYEIIAQIIAKIKNDLLACGCGIPVFLFHGMRANGKTSTIKACMENLDNVVKFSDGYREIKKKISTINPNEVLLVDNYPQYISSASRQQGKRILEYIVDQGSENPDFPLVVISAENYIYDDLVDSIRTRMLEIDVPKIEAVPILNEIRQSLIGHREDYLGLIQRFEKWYKCDKDKIKHELNLFRSKYSKSEYRTTGIVFSYYYACKLFSSFIHYPNGGRLDMGVIVSYCEKLLDNKKPNNKVSTIVSMMNSIIEDNGIFNVKEPLIGEYCERFLDGKCDYIVEKCHHCGECQECEINMRQGCKCQYSETVKFMDCYNPMDLRLETNENATVLIGRPTLMYQYPRYIGYDGPILIVPADDLLRIINITLYAYCIENDLELSNYGPKQLHKELFENNLCLYHYYTKDHKTYTFDYLDDNGQKRRVMLLKITKRQYKQLHNRARDTERLVKWKQEATIDIYEKHEYASFIRILKTMGNTVHALFKK